MFLATFSDVLVLERDIRHGLHGTTLTSFDPFYSNCNATPDLNRHLSTLLQRHSLIQTGFKDQNVQGLSMSLLPTSVTFTNSGMYQCV